MTPCPYCEHPVPESDLQCDSCRTTLPYCVITGYHVLSQDLSQCPHCQFPGIKAELLRVAQAQTTCPMCANDLNDGLKFPQLTLSQIKTINNNTNGLDEEEQDMNSLVNGSGDQEDSEEHESTSSNATGGSESRPTSHK